MTTNVANRKLESVPLWIFGSTGMLGGELMRLLEQHPALKPTAVSRKSGSLAETQPHVKLAVPQASIEAAELALAAALEAGPAAVALSLPHGESGELWKRLRSQLGTRVENLTLVDLAADFRLRDPELYRSTYSHAHPCPEELEGFAYGLPEFHRASIVEARRAAEIGRAHV